MRCINPGWLRRIQVASAAAALAAIAGCKGPDPTGFSCTSSAECPSGYHCDLGTASAAGSNKCANGAPQQKTLTVDPTKFLLAKGPGADGILRTTVSAGAGAVGSTPDFVGVRLIAKQGTTDVAQALVLTNGSVTQVQVPSTGQISLRVQDDSGHSVAVTGFNQQITMSFAGKDIAGNTNPITAYDAATTTDSLFDPTGSAGWISRLTEIPASSTVTNSIASPAAYNGLVDFDGISSTTSSPAQPSATGALGWEQISHAPTDTVDGFTPGARSAMAVAQIGIQVGSYFYPVSAYGGLDATGAAADATPTVFVFDHNNTFIRGWAPVPTNTSGPCPPGPCPANFASFGIAGAQLSAISKAGTALAPASSFNCTSGNCNGINYNMNLIVAGGIKGDGSLSNNIWGYGSRTIGSSIYLGWWDETLEGANLGSSTPHLLVPNARMASAVQTIPVASGITLNQFTGVVMVGGTGITAGAVNDAAACQYLTTFSFSGMNPTFQVSPCVTSAWATNAAAGLIGYRTGQALTGSDDPSEGNTCPSCATVYMFGGNRGGPAGTPDVGLKNDLWRGSIQVVCTVVTTPPTPPCAAGATEATAITWSPVPTAGTKPSPRAGSAIGFNDFRHLIVYGGTDATGPQQDVWQLDLSVPAPFPWTKLTLDPAPALAPGARTGAVMVGQTSYISNNAALLFGGSVGTTPTSDVWALSRQSAGRLLISAPAGMASPDTAVNLTMNVRLLGPGFFGAPLYIWNGANQRWDLVAAPLFGDMFSAVLNPLSYLQPDGSYYFLLNSRNRSTPTNLTTGNTANVDGMEVTLGFQ